MHRWFARVLFSFLLLASSSCYGQGLMKKVLSGYIREEGSGHVIGGARIELQNAFGTPYGNAYSDGNGAYEFDDIGGGDSYVVVQHEGYETFRQFIRPDGSGHVYKDIFLRPASSDSKPKSVSPVSEHELAISRKARESFDKGIQLIAEKSDYRGAVDQFAHAIAKYPNYYEAFAAMGLAQSRMGDAAAAEASLRKSVALSSEKYSQGMLDLASLLNGQHRSSEAEALLRKVIALDASSWRGQFELAVSLSGEKRFSEAVTAASEARDLKPDNPQVYLLLYNLHIHTDDFKAALSDTESYLKLTPDGATADRVRRMQEQVQKALQTSGGNPGPTSDAAPASRSPQSPVDADSPASGAVSNFTPADVPDLAPSSAPPDPPATAALPVSDLSPSTAVPPASPPAVASSVATSTDAKAPSDPSPTLSTDARPVVYPRVDELVPDVAVDVPCELSSVLHGAGKRAEELLNTLQKFDASERVEHYKLNAAGVPGSPDVRSFNYVVLVSQDSQGGFNLQEFRNGGVVSPRQFPSGIVTTNLAAHGLIFHPALAPDFNFSCEGLGEWQGSPTWLIHFEEKQHQLNPFRSYIIDGIRYPVLLTGRAWIDAQTHQVVRLESDLLKPVEKIHLTREHISIEFASVKFRTRKQQLWLPQTAELYVELNGHRFYRRHSFSNFRLFSTDSTQEVHAPREAFCFTNTTELLITGILNATPLSGKSLQPASITLTIPAKSTVCKSVGPGKDVNIPVESLASSKFVYDGPAGSVQADSYLPNGSSLEVIASGDSSGNERP